MEDRNDQNGNNSSNASNTKISAASSSPSPINAPAPQAVVNISRYFNFPPGYRFRPSDVELVRDYLERKIRNERLPPNHIVAVDLYNSNPKDLAETYRHLGEYEWYFFTSRTRKYAGGKRPNRSTGGGYWKVTGTETPIKHEENVIGFKAKLVFYLGKSPKGQMTNWNMHEYRVNGPPRTKKHEKDMTLDDWVLCKIDENSKRSPEETTRQNNQANQIQPDQEGDNEDEHEESQFESNQVVFHPNTALMEDNIVYDGNQTLQETAQGYTNELPDTEESYELYNNLPPLVAPDSFYSLPQINYLEDAVQSYTPIPNIVPADHHNNPNIVTSHHNPNNNIHGSVMNWGNDPNIVPNHHNPNNNIQGSVMNWGNNPSIVPNDHTPDNDFQGSVMNWDNNHSRNIVLNYHNINNFSGLVDPWGNTMSRTLPISRIPRFPTNYPARGRALGEHDERMQRQVGLPYQPQIKFQKIR